MENVENKDLQPKPRKRGKAPTIVRKEINDWLKGHDRNTYVNNYKTSGGYKPSGK